MYDIYDIYDTSFPKGLLRAIMTTVKSVDVTHHIGFSQSSSIKDNP